jgi:quercetin dioxygenase-like cupin family protein
VVEVILLGPDEGIGDGLLPDAASGVGTLRVESEELTVLEYTLESGSAGGEPHSHPHHVDAFYVLEGELEFRLPERSLEAMAGALVVAPPGVVHAFPGAPGGRARLLNLHAPGHWPAAGRRAATSTGTTASQTGIEFSAPGDGDAVGRSIIRVEREELTVLEYVLDADAGGGDLRVHRRHLDAFYILEGSLEFQLRDRVTAFPAGTLVAAPPGGVHAFPRAVGGPARFLNLHAPGGFHMYIRELARLRARGIEPDREFLAGHDSFPVPQVLGN